MGTKLSASWPNFLMLHIGRAFSDSYTEFIWSGKVRGEMSFSLRSGNVRETCNHYGKITLLYCRSGKNAIIISEVFDFFSLHLKFILL